MKAGALEIRLVIRRPFTSSRRCSVILDVRHVRFPLMRCHVATDIEPSCRPSLALCPYRTSALWVLAMRFIACSDSWLRVLRLMISGIDVERSYARLVSDAIMYRTLALGLLRARCRYRTSAPRELAMRFIC